MAKIETGKPALMRNLNRQIVLNIIRTKKLISKVEISKISNLKPPTVANIVKELLEENLILYKGKGKSNEKGGPRPDLFKLNPEGRFFIGIDIGVKCIVGVIVNLESEIVYKVSSKDRYETQEELTNILELIMNSLLDKSKINKSLIEGIGVGLAAFVDTEKGIAKASNIKVLNDYHIKKILEEKYRIKVHVENDINLIAIGGNWSDDKNIRYRNIICVGIRTGIGLGIIINGEVYRGRSGLSGNIGHYPLFNNGLLCDCGITGCLETIAGENAIINNVKEYIVENKDSVKNGLSQLGIKGIEDVDIDKIYYGLKQNNTIILQITKRALCYLGVIIGKMIQLFEPHAIIISGEIFNHNDILFDYLVNIAGKYCWKTTFENVQFEKFIITSTTIAHSAALQIIKEFFLNNTLNR